MPKLTTTYLQVTLVYLAVFFAYYPTTEVLFDRWLKLDESLSHGLLVIAMSIHLVCKYISQAGLSVQSKNITLTPAIGLLLSSLAWLVVSAANINIIEQFLIPIILWFALATLFGLRTGIAILLPVGFVYFSVPIWDYFNQVLVDLSSATVSWLVEAIGIAALIEENTITLPYGALVIADGCSGLRYFTIALALAVYVILDSKRNIKLSVQLLVAAIGLSLFSNWLRIFLLTLIAYETNMQSSLVADHETFGWILFCIVLAPLFFIARRFELFDQPKDQDAPSVKPKAVAIALAAVGLIVGPALSAALHGAFTAPAINALEVSKYTAVTNRPALPTLPKAKYVLQKRANNYLQDVRLYQVLNWRETNSDSLVPYWPALYSQTDWRAENLAPVKSDITQYAFVQLTHKLRGLKYCLAYRYQVGSYNAPSYKEAKLLQIPTTLVGGNTFEAQVAITKLNGASCNDLRQAIKQATQELSPLVQASALPRNEMGTQ